jgi:hypothetical protein
MMGRISILLGLALAVLTVGPALADYEVVVDRPELMIVRNGVDQSLYIPGEAYSEVEYGETGATFRLVGGPEGSGSQRVMGEGISRVSWQPADDGEGTLVEVQFTTAPASSIINAIPGSEMRPYMPQVVAGFYFNPAESPAKPYPVLGSRKPGGHASGPDPHGEYKLPRLPESRYSDALVNLSVRNVDFRDVLWLMSEIGNVSIVLDPYWADEPTGSRRTVGGGADPGAGGGSGDGGAGYRGAGDFVPAAPREGTGNLSLNFKDVPFDLALDLVIMSVGLVKVDIYPGDLD